MFGEQGLILLAWCSADAQIKCVCVCVCVCVLGGVPINKSFHSEDAHTSLQLTDKNRRLQSRYRCTNGRAHSHSRPHFLFGWHASRLNLCLSLPSVICCGLSGSASVLQFCALDVEAAAATQSPHRARLAAGGIFLTSGPLRRVGWM